MPNVVRASWLRALARASVVAAIAFTGCTLGDAPLSPGSDTHKRLSIRPQFVRLGGSYQSAPINRIHLVARTHPDLILLADTILEVRADDPAWSIGIDLRLPEGLLQTSAIVTIELINVSATGQTIEWSGVTEPISVTAGGASAPPPSVPVFPGPPANLSVTNVTVTPGDISLMEGDSTVFSAAVEGATGAALVAWSTLDPAVAAISANGTVRGLRDGAARIVAQVGPKSDTVIARFSQRPVSLNIEETSVTAGSIGQEVTLSVRMLDARGAAVDGSTNFSVADAGIAEQTGAGRFRARANGRTMVYATSAVRPSLRDSAQIVVAQVAATVAISPSSSVLNAIGSTETFTVAGRDALGTEVVATPVWSTDNAAVATVDASGTTRSVSNGTAHITATYPGGARAAVTVTVAQQPASVDVSPATTTLTAINDTVRAGAAARDANAAPMPAAPITWSSSSSAVASVDGNGLVRAVGRGTATITARTGSVAGVTQVVVAPRAAAVTVTPGNANAITTGQRIAFSASAADRGGAPLVAPTFGWRSSNSAVATVDGAGNATTRGNGTAFIVAEIDGARDSAALTVRQTAATVMVSSRDTLAIGSTAALTASALDAADHEIEHAAFVWSSSAPGVATVDQDGVVRGVGDGTSEISVTVDGRTAVTTVAVYQAGPASIDLVPGFFQFNSLNEQQAIRTVIRNGRNVQITASSTRISRSPRIAEVTGTNLVIARSVGTTTIVATAANGVTTTATVNVRQLARRIDVSIPTTMAVGTDANATGTPYDALDNLIPNATVAWSSNAPGIATVDGNGAIHAVASGNVTISATRDEFTVSRQVSVFRPGPATMTVTPNPLVFDALGSVTNLIAVPRDENNNVLNDEPVTFTSNDVGVVTVNSAGAATSIGNGSTTITVRAGDVTVNVPVTVGQVGKSIEVSPEHSVIETVGGQVQLSSVSKDKNGRIIPGSPSNFSTRNPEVATVTSNGLVTATGVGTARIIGKFGNVADTVTVDVLNPAVELPPAPTANLIVESATVTPSELVPGSTYQVHVVVRNTGTGNAAATFAEFKLRAGAGGPPANLATVTIPVPILAAGASATFDASPTLAVTQTWPDAVVGTITVDAGLQVAETNETDNTWVTALNVRVPVTSVTLTGGTSVNVGSTLQLAAAAFYSSRKNNGTLNNEKREVFGRVKNWVSLTPAIATVDANGLVTGVSSGQVDIRVTIEGVVATLRITVINTDND